MTRIDVFQAKAIGKNIAFGAGKTHEDLAGCRLSPRSVHDLDLPLLDEIIVLHHRVHAFDAKRNID